MSVDNYIEALTPSRNTKADYMGEFHFPIEDNGRERKITVPWTTIKEIMAHIKARAEGADNG